MQNGGVEGEYERYQNRPVPTFEMWEKPRSDLSCSIQFFSIKIETGSSWFHNFYVDRFNETNFTS